MKFGGTSVADARSIGRVAGIVGGARREGHEVAVVVSAMRGITDGLIACAGEMVTTADAEPGPFLAAVRERQAAALAEVAPDYAEAALLEIETRLASLGNVLRAVHALRELTPRSRDYIISFGERFSAIVVAAALRQLGFRSEPLDGCAAGILTDGNHGEAVALPGSGERIRERVVPLLAGSIPVIMGFMGCTEEGSVTTLGRSGSDYSAAVLAAGIDADECWIWTDVDGVMTCDPRLIPGARVIPAVSYLEAMELSYFGAKVLHPRSIEPAMAREITIRVKNTFNPDHPGTVLVADGVPSRRIVKALTFIDRVALVNCTGVQMIGRPGVAKAIFAALADRAVNVMMISQGSSEANISLIVDEGHLEAAVGALEPLVASGLFRQLSSDSDVAVVAVVGSGMAGAPGTGGRIFSALGREGINVMMISQGSSEANISFVVRAGDGPAAVRALHDEFRLSEFCDDE
ncbi:MAG: aspartate kinase [Methanospirillum sp.]|nr:aspartate kinase [Methanospirillum sp.]